MGAEIAAVTLDIHPGIAFVVGLACILAPFQGYGSVLGMFSDASNRRLVDVVAYLGTV